MKVLGELESSSLARGRHIVTMLAADCLGPRLAGSPIGENVASDRQVEAKVQCAAARILSALCWVVLSCGRLLCWHASR